LRFHRTSSRYPLFPGDKLDYSILFVQPKMMGGTHVDDGESASYFFLQDAVDCNGRS